MINRLEYMREWRKKNATHVKQKRKVYYLANKEKILAKSFGNYHKSYKFKRKNNSEHYKELDKQSSLRKRAKRRDLLQSLRKELGGKCSRCDYSEEIRILQFHHHEDNKIDNVTNLQSLPRIEVEARKCILLCPNCHAIEHLP